MTVQSGKVNERESHSPWQRTKVRVRGEMEKGGGGGGRKREREEERVGKRVREGKRLRGREI